MAKRIVWTRQNAAVLEQLERDGRFIAREEFMRSAMEDTSEIMFQLYHWLATHMPTQAARPADASYPIWVALSRETCMPPETGIVMLELEVDEEVLALADITKWTRMMNYSYIPLNSADNDEHNSLLERYGIDDAKALMTPFYPQIRAKILKSWERLFDDSVVLGGAGSYGLLWEVRREWIRRISE